MGYRLTEKGKEIAESLQRAKEREQPAEETEPTPKQTWLDTIKKQFTSQDKGSQNTGRW